MSRDLIIDDVIVKVQCNPSRITSSTANTSKTAILERPCFLCPENRPPEQEGLLFRHVDNDENDTDFIILVNPFPVFPRHYTIAGNHIQQSITGHFETMVQLARHLDDCVVFYNGPQCGASAPDHLHFQAGSKGLMPVESDYKNWKREHLSLLLNQNNCDLYILHNFLRSGWLIESSDKTALAEIFYKLQCALVSKANEEPMQNILCWYSDLKWHCIIFPRKVHRPSCYFRQDEFKLLISPASVEMGGLVVAARPEDFRKIDAEDIKKIYNEVAFSESEMKQISKKVQINNIQK
jgi:ATP adenylyltransferase/5',5'''-P-1,P-4-tetraphosphate phosphorylase II